MWRAFLILHFLIIISFSPAWAEKRVALVIGNAAYEHTTRLNNPPKDAPDMAAALERIGFDVELKSDLGYAELRKAIRYFGKKARGAEMAIIYYAGHGMELGGQNWLIPTDAKLLSDEDMEDEALSLNYVMGKVEGTGTLALVILDACRDNPFKRSMKQVRGVSRSVSRGLSRVEPEGNLLVAFAARDGTIALDGTPGANSPYASAWLKHMATPGLDIRLLLGRIRDDVKAQSKKLGRYVQEPFFYGSLPGTRIELVPGKETPATSQADAKTSDEKFEKMQKQLQKLEERLRKQQQAAIAVPPKPKNVEQTPPFTRPPPSNGVTIEQNDKPSSPAEVCTWNRKIRYCTSSVLRPQGRNTYRPSNLFDGSRKTAWVEGRSGQGVGEWILLEFPDPISVFNIRINNGYGKNNDIFRKNSRIKDIEICFSHASCVTRRLKDRATEQFVQFAPQVDNARWIALRILSVYKGWKYSDTAVSELEVNIIY